MKPSAPETSAQAAFHIGEALISLHREAQRHDLIELAISLQAATELAFGNAVATSGAE